MCLLAIHVSPLAKCLFKSIAHEIFLGYLPFLLLICKSSVYILVVNFMSLQES